MLLFQLEVSRLDLASVSECWFLGRGCNEVSCRHRRHPPLAASTDIVLLLYMKKKKKITYMTHIWPILLIKGMSTVPRISLVWSNGHDSIYIWLIHDSIYICLIHELFETAVR